MISAADILAPIERCFFYSYLSHFDLWDNYSGWKYAFRPNLWNLISINLLWFYKSWLSAMFCAKAKVKPGGMMTCAQLRSWLCCSSGGPQIMEPKVPSSSHHHHHHHLPHSALAQPSVVLALKKFTVHRLTRSPLVAATTISSERRAHLCLAGPALEAPGGAPTPRWMLDSRLAQAHRARHTSCQAHRAQYQPGTLSNQTQHQNAASTQTIFTLRNCKIRSQWCKKRWT